MLSGLWVAVDMRRPAAGTQAPAVSLEPEAGRTIGGIGQ
jgi:hypothetical protein